MAESGGLQGADDMGRLVGEVGVAEGENSVAANTWITSEVRAVSERRPGPDRDADGDRPGRPAAGWRMPFARRGSTG
ncbi:hypothetical protein QFZ55_008050 [Streptomyces luteogriseus]|uniref:hypothetical protein n=1 Tax=Streptomyces luteogriseus TaxID=68233 RepID=UPI002782820D|nr:hypothetical protein [Streptomyces luteogriseus]MDQ0718598.1 hypothetical protein [Streptomyces luteogriseus]